MRKNSNERLIRESSIYNGNKRLEKWTKKSKEKLVAAAIN